MLCRSSSRSRTQLSHTARGTGRSARGPFPGLPSPLSPGLQDTDLHTSRCPDRLPLGSRAGAGRRRTASRSARWSRCTPRCGGRRTPLGTRTLTGLITEKRPRHHFVPLPPRREGKGRFYSRCAIASLRIYAPLLGASHSAQELSQQPVVFHLPTTQLAPVPPNPRPPPPCVSPGTPGAGLTRAAALAEAPVARGTLLAARAADAGPAAALPGLCVAAAPHSAHVAVAPPAARAPLEAVVPLLGKSRAAGSCSARGYGREEPDGVQQGQGQGPAPGREQPQAPVQAGADLLESSSVERDWECWGTTG